MAERTQGVIAQIFAASAGRQPEKPVLAWGDDRFTRGDLDRRIADIAAALLAADVPPTEVVLAVDSHSPVDIFTCIHAALRIGANAVLVDPTAPESDRQLQSVRVGATHTLRASSEGPAGVETATPKTKRRSPLVGSEIVFFTSGTTGAPKAIVHSDDTIAAALWLLLVGNDLASNDGREQLSESQRLETFLEAATPNMFESGPVLVSCMPPSSHAGFTMMNYASLAGSLLGCIWPFDPGQALDFVVANSASSIGLSPFMAQLLLREQHRRPRDCSSLFVVGLGSSNVDPSLALEIEAVMGASVSIGYGLTETGGAATRTRFADSQEERCGSVGRPLPGVEIALGEPDDDGIGRIRILSPAVMTAEIEVDGRRSSIRSGAWIETEDLGYITEPGALHVIGRESDLIIRGGRKIDPAKVEAAIRLLPAVLDCCVVGTQSRIAGEEDVTAVIVAGGPLTLTSMRKHCSTLLDRHEIPTHLEHVDEIPRTADGAVARSRQRQLLATR